MKRKKWSIKYMILGDPPDADLDIIFEDSRFESAFYSNGIFTFIGTEDDVADLIENRVVDWKIVAPGEFNLS